VIRQYELVEKVRAYDEKADERLLNRAYVFSMKAHGAQKRASGDPYFSHPLEVAGILTDMRLDGATIVTALLHDTIEDTVATLPEITELFGSEIARLVDGVTKLSRIELSSEQSKQAENFRKLLLAMSSDIRVLLVKLADRLHNMRTLHYIKSDEKRRRIARETMEIYAPLAERIGMQAMKEELEDLAFSELHPDARESILKRLEFLREQAGDLRLKVIHKIERLLAEQNIEARVKGREKRPYSIWRKMTRENISFEQLSDVMAFRILVPERMDCYRALGVAHANWTMVPNRFKDYISTPKANGYQSIHTTLLGPERQRIEIQIRTFDMHEVAEYGVAAHWQYKQQAGKVDGMQYRWLRELLEILEHAQSPEEFLEHTKIELFQDQVFCFTPKGDLIALPVGATPVDFAYAVHTKVGHTCVGAKVNGRIVPLRTRLKNGDQVEIVRSKAQTPSPQWEAFAATGKARSAIRRFIRDAEKTEYARLGQAIVEKIFVEEGQDAGRKAITAARKKLKMATDADLFVSVGKGLTKGREVFEAAFPGIPVPESVGNVVALAQARDMNPGDHPVIIKGLIAGVAVHMAECCRPLPGDRIVAILEPGKGATIHTIDCKNLEKYADAPDRWLDVAWDKSAESKLHVGRIVTTVDNHPGTLGEVATIIGRYHGNITNLELVDRNLEFFTLQIDVEVQDLKHLTNIIAALRVTAVVNEVERVRG
jgi:GTP pyrophosphokinase